MLWFSLQRKALTVGKVRIMTLNYEWQRFYKAALSEAQPGKMQEAISNAEHAIQERLADCPPPIMEAAEKRAGYHSGAGVA